MDNPVTEYPAHPNGELRTVNILGKLEDDKWLLMRGIEQSLRTVLNSTTTFIFHKIFQNIRIKTVIRTNMETETLFLAIMIMISGH